MTRGYRTLAMGLIAWCGVGSSAALAQPSCTQPAWATPLASPTERASHAVAYDEARGRVVLFGGVNSGFFFGDTWEHDGVDWTLRALSGPPSRDDCSLAFDSARKRCVMFGGYSRTLDINPQDIYYADTWEWDGAAWVQRATTGPSSRRHYALAFDPIRNKTFLFGGIGPGGLLGDTWEWNGTAWTELAIAGPSPRRNAGVAWDPVRGAIVLFGGASDAESLGDTWTFDGSAWTPLGAGAPGQRAFAKLAFDLTQGRMILFGGMVTSGEFSAETWALNPTSGNWEVIAGGTPPARGFHSMAYNRDQRRALIFGGFHFAPPADRTYFADTWSFDGTSWSRSAPPVEPGARTGHGASAIPGAVLLFGGNNGTNDLNDTWAYTSDGWVARSVSGPSPRRGVAMAGTLLFGGMSGDAGSPTFLGDTWTWDAATNAWIQRAGAAPSTRADAAVAYDDDNDRYVLFGGRNGGTSFGDTWIYNGQTNQWSQVGTLTAPAPRSASSMCYVDGTFYLFGGRLQGDALAADTWSFNGTTWSPVTPPASFPTARAGHRFVAGPGATEAHLFGGTLAGGAITGDVWRFAAGAWTLVADSQPGVDRSGHAMVAGAGGGVLFVYGGSNAIGPGPAIPPQLVFGTATPQVIRRAPRNTTAIPFNDVALSATAFGLAPLSYQWRKDGTNLNDGAGVSGATTETLRLISVDESDAGVYSVVVGNACGGSATASAQVRVRCPADFDDGSGTGTPDGGVDSSDVIFFFAAFENGDPRIDIDDGSGTGTPDGGVDVSDVLYFVTRWRAGC